VCVCVCMYRERYLIPINNIYVKRVEGGTRLVIR